MRALIIGRFQPFHLGHLNVIKKITEECDAIIISIGSAQYSHTLENPFTAGERYLMLSKTLEKEKILNYYIVPVEDVNRYDVWVSHVEALVPPFDVVYTNNPLTKRLFLEKGYRIKGMPMYDRTIYSGREIRKKMWRDENWGKLVPEQVAEVINEIDGVKRLKTLIKTDIHVPENKVASLMFEKNVTVSVAESCTGGLLSHLLTNIPDSSRYFMGGRIVYSDNAKKMLGISEKTIEAFGSVSPQVSLELAKKIREKNRTDIGIGITGFAGPSGDVGKVYIALISEKEKICKSFKFSGSREEIKERTAKEGLKILKEYLEKI
jgi:nicotinamide-nucleotide adenylyltransferase